MQKSRLSIFNRFSFKQIHKNMLILPPAKVKPPLLKNTLFASISKKFSLLIFEIRNHKIPALLYSFSHLLIVRCLGKLQPAFLKQNEEVE